MTRGQHITVDWGAARNARRPPSLRATVGTPEAPRRNVGVRDGDVCEAARPTEVDGASLRIVERHGAVPWDAVPNTASAKLLRVMQAPTKLTPLSAVVPPTDEATLI